MKGALKYTTAIAIALFLNTAAKAECRVAPDSGDGVWKKDIIKTPHFIIEEGNKCYLKLKNRNPLFRVTGMWIDHDAHLGTVEAAGENPSWYNSFVYTPKPGLHGEDVVVVHFDTEMDCKPYDTIRAKWRVTVT